MYGLFGKMIAQPGQRDTLVGYLMQGMETLRALEGCYIYVVANDPTEPDAIWITEVWRSKADHQASLANEAIRAVITAARPLIADMPQHTEFIPVGGKGLHV